MRTAIKTTAYVATEGNNSEAGDYDDYRKSQTIMSTVTLASLIEVSEDGDKKKRTCMAIMVGYRENGKWGNEDNDEYGAHSELVRRRQGWQSWRIRVIFAMVAIKTSISMVTMTSLYQVSRDDDEVNDYHGDQGDLELCRRQRP